MTCLVCLMAAGCSTQDLARLQAARATTVTAVDQARQARAALQQQITALPADDPVRKAAEPQLARLDTLIAKTERYLSVLDGVIQSAQTNQIDPSLQSAVASIPYGSLALAAVGIVWGLVKHLQAGKTLAEGEDAQSAFAQMVKALDAALPQPTDQQKAAIASVLDSEVKSRAAIVRAT